ncbi:M protein [Sodak rhabdovirus 1]|uniref:M protein n=1 Tax=Sodak rhabdovirus 1 TaxID=2793799 RepID=A0A7T1NV53_9RHAB|nr:M protein [Sodak rhabdovirus 1]QPO14169.1 M protein [Sodak rhabdovirus 1]
MLRRILGKNKVDTREKHSLDIVLRKTPNSQTSSNLVSNYSGNINTHPHLVTQLKDYHNLNIEVNVYLEISSNRDVSIMELSQHLNQYFTNYSGQYKLYNLNFALLALCLSSVDKSVVASNSAYPFRFKSSFETVMSIYFLESKLDVISNKEIHFVTNWNSLGINYRTHWTFRTSYKKSTVPGIILNYSGKALFYKILKQTDLTYKIVDNILVIG